MDDAKKSPEPSSEGDQTSPEPSSSADAPDAKDEAKEEEAPDAPEELLEKQRASLQTYNDAAADLEKGASQTAPSADPSPASASAPLPLSALGPGAHSIMGRGSRPSSARNAADPNAAGASPPPILEATLVPEEPEVPVYDAVRVNEQAEAEAAAEDNRSWWEKHQKNAPYIGCAVGFVVASVALVVGLSVGLQNPDGGDADASEPEVSFGKTPSAAPSESLAPTPDLYFPSLARFNGDAPGDLNGGSVALSANGRTVAVSSGQLGNGGPGYVDVYSWNETLSEYAPRGERLVGDAAGDAFGYSLDLSDDAQTLVIGAAFHSNSTGMATVYQWNETALQYTQFGETLYGDAVDDTFGEVVVLSSDGATLAVSASGKDIESAGDESGETAALENVGQVKVYKVASEGSSFEQVGEALNGEGAEDRFGYSMSIDATGSTLVVGAPGNDENGADTGSAQVYEWDAESSNYKLRSPPLYGDAGNSRYGWSSALSGDGNTLAIGALLQSAVGQPFNEANSDAAGRVYTLIWNEASSQYEQVGDVLQGDENRDDFSASISLAGDGKTLAVGSPMKDGNGIQSGQVSVFTWDEAGAKYTALGDPINGEKETNYFGGPVSLSGDGTTLAVGAVGNDNNGPFSGQLEIFGIPVAEGEGEELFG
ncbi:hypothetical protein ACHAXT_012345 [Thalassiosira profunda]